MEKTLREKRCSVAECDGVGWVTPSGSVSFVKGYCKKHHARLRRGLDPHANTMYDKRPAIIEGNVAKIPLNMNGSKGYALVDMEFAWLADKHLWSKSGDGYAIATVNGKTLRMHHAVLGKPPKGKDTDHINRVKTDNRKANLRFVSRSDNVHNVGLRSHNTSGHKNIYWNKQKGRWAVSIVIAQKNVLRKNVKDLEVAIKLRDDFRQRMGI